MDTSIILNLNPYTPPPHQADINKIYLESLQFFFKQIEFFLNVEGKWKIQSCE